MDDLAQGPYAIAYRAYWAAGWSNVLPVHDGQGKPGKSHVPRGYTGQDGRNVSWPDLNAWALGDEGRHNLGVRLIAMVGIDVDAHDGEQGAATLAKAEAELGPLPPTWSSTSRGEGSSRILFFRVPLEREPALRRREKVFNDTFGPNVEILHRGHRFAVCWPSVHPDTGMTYQWYGPDGLVCGAPPKRGDVPLLPDTWLDFLAPGEPFRNGPEPSGTAEAGGSLLFGTSSTVPDYRTEQEAARILREAVQAFIAPDADGRARRLLPALALTAGHGVPGGFWTAEKASAQIEQMGIACGYVKKHGLADLRLQVERGLRDGAATPWVKVAEPAQDAFASAQGDGLGRLRRAMLRRDAIDAMPDPVWLIEDVMHAGTVVVLAGKFGTYKSFVAIGWAASLATGRDWFGHRVPARGAVIYAAAEGAAGIKRRLRAWEAHTGVRADDFILIPVSVRLNRPEDVAELESIIAETGARAIIYDTLHASTPGADENHSGDMGAVLDVLRGLQERHGVTAILPHHTGHAGERARGSSSIEDDADTTFVVKLDGEERGPSARRVMHHRKTKDGALLDPVTLTLKMIDGTGSGVVTNDPWKAGEIDYANLDVEPWRGKEPELWTARVAEGKATWQRRILQVLCDHARETGMTQDEVRKVVTDRWSKPASSSWADAWQAVKDMDIAVNVRGERWTVDPVSVDALKSGKSVEASTE